MQEITTIDKKPHGACIFSEEISMAICEGIASGKSLSNICRDESMPGYSTVFRWLHEYPEFERSYTRAREAQAARRAEQMLKIMEDMRNGLIDHNMARVELGALQWLAARESPRLYGESTTIKGDKDNPLTIQALATALDDRLRTRIEHKDSDDKA